MGARPFLLIGVFVLLAALAQAAVIQGDVYNFDLTPANHVIVEVTTTPHQQVVAQNGTYQVNVPPGSYTLTAVQRDKGKLLAETSENITVAGEGTYTLDLILFPSFNESEFNVDIEGPITAVDETPATNWPLVIGIVAGIVIVLVIVIVVSRRKRRAAAPTHKSDIANLIDALQKNGGRMTQKELRKQFPHSEAKVSLMLTELEHKGVVEKIRKGRSNVIVLKK
jgi:uncharacterized membrane protein